MFPGPNSVTIEQLAKSMMKGGHVSVTSTCQQSQPASKLSCDYSHKSGVNLPEGQKNTFDLGNSNTEKEGIKQLVPESETQNVSSDSESILKLGAVVSDTAVSVENSSLEISNSINENCSSLAREPPKKKLKSTSESPFERVLFIDSTWNQVRSIYSDERLQGMWCTHVQNAFS